MALLKKRLNYGFKMPHNKLNYFIQILLNKTASISERDDAAIDLGNFDSEEALDALLSVARDKEDDDSIMDVCGESIAQIWVRRNQIDIEAYKNLHPYAQHEAKMYIEMNKPEWSKFL